MKRAVALAAALAALTGLSACGEKQDRTTAAAPADTHTIRLMLDYLPNPDHVGLYAAIAGGEFAAAGLDVEVEVPSDPAAPMKLLQAGKVDLAITYQPELLIARDKGAPVVSVGAIVQRPLTSLMTLKRRAIRKPADLRGKTVGTAGIPYQSAYLSTILKRAGVPRSSVKEISVGFNLVPAMLSRRIDATLGAFWNVEGVQLERKRRKPRIIRMDEVGVPTYNELVLVGRQDFVGERGDDVRAFVQALGRGYAAARADPAAATQALVEANPALDRGFALASVRASLPVFFPREDDKPFGFQRKREWDSYARWMFEQGLLSRRPHGALALTNEFLAGQSG